MFIPIVICGRVRPVHISWGLCSQVERRRVLSGHMAAYEELHQLF